MQFFGKRRKDGAHVVRWSRHTVAKLHDEHWADRYWLCFLRDIMAFGAATPSEQKASEWAGIFDLRNPYTEDGGLFELACFRFVELDYFLYNNFPDLRDTMAHSVMKDLLSVFEAAFGKIGVYEAFRFRVEAYGKIIREDGFVESNARSEHLINLLCLASSGQFCSGYDFRSGGSGERQLCAYDYMGMMSRETAWYVTATPIFLLHTQRHCEQLEGNC